MSPISYTSCILSNGLKVVNFSSPHPFTFDTGEILPACHKEWVNKMSLDITETEEPWNGSHSITDVKLHVSIPKYVLGVLERLEANGDIDVVIIPFMLLQALKDSGHSYKKCRVIRLVDRVTKIIHSNKFCI